MYSSARTKKVATYGRRVQRFIPVTKDGAFSKDSPLRKASVSKVESEDEDLYDLPLRSLPKTTKTVPKKLTAGGKSSSGKHRKSPHGKAKDKTAPARRPLAVCAVNIPGSPAVTLKRVPKKGSPAHRLRPASPTVDVDIIIVDDKGRRLSHERRVTKTNVQMNNMGMDTQLNTRKTPNRAAKSTARRMVAKSTALESDDDDDDDDEYVPITKAARNKLKPRPTRIPTKISQKLAVQEEESDSAQSDSLEPKKLLASRKAKRAIIESDSESSVDSEPSLTRPPIRPTALTQASTSQGARQKKTKRSNEGRENPIVLDLSRSPKLKATAGSVRHPPSPQPVPVDFSSAFWRRDSYNRAPSSPEASISYEGSHRPHQLTPVRTARTKPSFMQQLKPCPIQNKIISDDDYDVSLSMSIDPELELALKVAELEIGDSPSSSILGELGHAQGHSTRSSKSSSSSVPSAKKQTHSYLRPLLAECGQIMPFEFNAFIETFPFDPIHAFSEHLGHETTYNGFPSGFQKIGEASYSEVFGIGDVVLKVIPLSNEDEAESLAKLDPNTPPTSEAKDVLREILVTKTMGEICRGFIKLLKAHVVQGAYPSQLLALWDVYNDVKGSESVRPDTFNDSQAYAIIILPNGGPDLETFSMSSTEVGWRQSCSIFWQVALALARAEDLVHFEHRDLHWGQILIRRTKKQLWSRSSGEVELLPLDDPTHGVEATIIDLGLSRIGQGNLDTYWTPLSEDIFEGEGDYQYDIYRMMCKHNGDDWESFSPLTNVMWLHYLAEKLLNNKRLRPPTLRATTVERSRKALPVTSRPALTEADKRAYDCLAEVEKFLGLATAPIARSVGVKRRKRTKSIKQPDTEPLGVTMIIESAADVIRLGQKRQWIL